MPKYTTAVFDFDGTLVDSSEGIINCVLYALDKYGIQENDREKLTYFIGPPLFDSFRDLYGVSDEDADLLISYYRERYHVKGILEGKVYDGIRDMLIRLKQAGMTTAVCSSKPEKFVIDISRHFGLLEHLDHISAVSFQDKNADKTPLLQKALNLCGVSDPRTAVMVGDRHFDMTAAVNLSVTPVGVSYGFGSVQELEDAGAVFVAHDVPELQKFLTEGK